MEFAFSVCMNVYNFNVFLHFHKTHILNEPEKHIKNVKDFNSNMFAFDFMFLFK